MADQEKTEPTASKPDHKKAPRKRALWERILAIAIGIVLGKLLINWLFGPA